MKEIYIHVGPEKTGTSSIQFWCQKNREYLEREGIFYPPHALDENGVSSGHRGLILSKLEGKKEEFVDRVKVEEIIANFENSDFKTLLLSSENFYRYLPQILDLVPGAKFIFYVRANLDIQFSIYNQGIKRGGQSQPFPHKSPNSKLLQLSLEGSQYSSMIFKVFEKSLFYKNDLVSDFLSVLNVDPTIEDNNSKVINTSYTYDCLEFKRFLNNFPITRKVDKRLDVVLQSLELGDSKFSFVSNDYYKKYNDELMDKIASFLNSKNLQIDKFNDYAAVMRKKENKNYKKQYLNFETFSKVLGYVDSADSEVCAIVLKLIKNNVEIREEISTTYEWVDKVVDIDFSHAS